ncbi:hypothetical protein CO731_04848 [Aminobacter sp. MSH1]|uniref:hypothetical protein n=1 Tax=Aminobacter sp. MSH1 TaxID=374606 RepID=UPI000D50592D|nr:hypothetical protein [Aminobacter sp. MSH1]AWC25353.1 hypothetical protein CO731_04848 [Aminobacter sp. MSH1]
MIEITGGEEYSPENWFWIVGGDERRYWSSEAVAYVKALPKGAGVTRIASEDELTDVLSVYGLTGPIYRVPDRVTARQFKLQLLAEGLLDHVEGWVASQGKAIQLAYDNSGTFARDESMMQAGFKALGFPPEQIDAFFSAASKR